MFSLYSNVKYLKKSTHSPGLGIIHVYMYHIIMPYPRNTCNRYMCVQCFLFKILLWKSQLQREGEKQGKTVGDLLPTLSFPQLAVLARNEPGV